MNFNFDQKSIQESLKEQAEIKCMKFSDKISFFFKFWSGLQYFFSKKLHLTSQSKYKLKREREVYVFFTVNCAEI